MMRMFATTALQVEGISVPVTARRIFFVKQVEESSPLHESAPISSQRVVLGTSSDWSAKEAAATPVSQTMETGHTENSLQKETALQKTRSLSTEEYFQ
jgi:hypothetical protein